MSKRFGGVVSPRRSVTTRQRPHRPRAAPSRRPEREPELTIGVEEEFLLLDPDTGVPVPGVNRAVGAMPEHLRGHTRVEFRACQFELASAVTSELGQLRRHLTQIRSAAAEAAHAAGARLVAIGAAPVADPRPVVSDEPRYAEMAERFGALANDPAVCGCHVHIGVDDRELAVLVSNHLRLQLPTLQAMTANSPFCDGVDTGYASWRSILFGRWPSVGPTPHFKDASAYDAAVRRMIDSGVMMDEAMVYWYARLSARYPTIEVRVGDVCPTVGDTVLVAALVRGLVAHAVDQVRRGVLAPPVPDSLVSAAHWRAAREGLDGELVDLRDGAVRPAWDVVDAMVDAARPALTRLGDWPTVARHLAALRRWGNGATRQRRIHRRSGTVGAVLDELVTLTTDGRISAG
jgi:carboxylate-amine ligase